MARCRSMLAVVMTLACFGAVLGGRLPQDDRRVLSAGDPIDTTNPVGPTSTLSINGASVTIRKVSAAGVMDASWMEVNNTQCVGQILYNITNTGDSTVAPSLAGPIAIQGGAAGASTLLASPGSYLYNTTAPENTTFATNLNIFDVGYYMLGNGGSSLFALTVKCAKSSCPCDWLPTTFAAAPGANTTDGENANRCVAPNVLSTSKACVSVARDQSAANIAAAPKSMDVEWINNGSCQGQVRYRIYNGGLKPIAPALTGSPAGSPALSVSLSNGLQLAHPEDYLYKSSAAVNATSFTITEAGYYTRPGDYSIFSLSLWCPGKTCPCLTGAQTISNSIAITVVS